MAKQEVTINRDDCIGCSMCAELAKGIFEIDKDDKATIKKKELSEKDLALTKDAEENCPVRAIKVTSK